MFCLPKTTFALGVAWTGLGDELKKTSWSQMVDFLIMSRSYVLCLSFTLDSFDPTQYGELVKTIMFHMLYICHIKVDGDRRIEGNIKITGKFIIWELTQECMRHDSWAHMIFTKLRTRFLLKFPCLGVYRNKQL